MAKLVEHLRLGMEGLLVQASPSVSLVSLASSLSTAFPTEKISGIPVDSMALFPTCVFPLEFPLDSSGISMDSSGK